MPQVINTNISSLVAQKNLDRSQGSLQTSLQRLSSGLRVNSAKDDAAGLAIATSITSQIGGMEQARRNANDGISFAQVAEGALDEVTNMLLRMRTLAVQASSDTFQPTDRDKMEAEFVQLSAEVDRVIKNTEFNGVSTFEETADGTAGKVTVAIQVGIGNYTSDASNKITLEYNHITAEAPTGGVTGLNVWDTVNGVAYQSVDAAADAQTAITALDTALGEVATVRSELGAGQSRMSSVVNGLANTIENLSAARGRIMDADFAVETAGLTRASILQQAGVSVLAQANGLPNNVLALLQ